MSEFPFGEVDQDYAEARQELQVALNNPDYLQIAIGEGPLELDEVNKRDTEEVRSVVNKYEWPSHSEDGLMEPVYSFPSPEEFLESLCPEDMYGKRHLSSSPFIRLLQCHPIAHISEVVRMDDAMGAIPVVHRAHALAPAFFEPLRVVVNKLQDRYGGVSDKDNLYDELKRPSHDDVVEAIYMAYRIMGRLIKVRDPLILATQQGFKDRAAYERVILNADEALRHVDAT